MARAYSITIKGKEGKGKKTKQSDKTPLKSDLFNDLAAGKQLDVSLTTLS